MSRQALLVSLDQVSDDYLILLLTGLLTAIPIVALYTLVRDQAPIAYVLIDVFLLIALLVSFHRTLRAIKRNCMLTRIETGLDALANRDLSLRAVESIGWKVIESYKPYLTAVTGISAFTWGQEITVIFDNGCVYLNCRNRSGLAPGRSPWLFGRGNKCLSQFSDEIQKLKGRAA